MAASRRASRLSKKLIAACVAQLGRGGDAEARMPGGWSARAWPILPPSCPTPSKGLEQIDLRVRDPGILRRKVAFRFGEGALRVEPLQGIDGALALLCADDDRR